MPPVAIAAVALGTVAVGTAVQVQQGRKAAKANAAASALDRQRMNLQNARERREAIKATRAANAQIQQGAENQGAAYTSGAAGGQGSVVSQGAANLSFLDQYNTLTDMASIQLGRANRAQSRAAEAGAVADLGWAVFGQKNNITKVWGQ